MAEGSYKFTVAITKKCIVFPSTAAPSVDDILTTDDSANILEELHEAQNHSYLLGLMLKLKTSDVKAIHATYQEPKERLSHVITEFLNQTKPRPTWRVIINALRTRTVNLQALAKRIESTRFPDPTSTRNVVPEMTGRLLIVCMAFCSK